MPTAAAAMLKVVREIRGVVQDVDRVLLRAERVLTRLEAATRDARALVELLEAMAEK